MRRDFKMIIHYAGGFEIEVIGNIYENAELLKDEKD